MVLRDRPTLEVEELAPAVVAAGVEALRDCYPDTASDGTPERRAVAAIFRAMMEASKT